MKRVIHILIVDSNCTDRRFCKAILEKAFESVDIDEVETKESFCNALDSVIYDLIITDYYLQGFTGVEIIDAVKSRHLDIPVVIYTGLGNEEIAVEVMRTGAADYIHKSLKQIDRLPLTVQRVLENADAKRAEKKSVKRSEKINQCFLSFVTDPNENINSLTKLCGELVDATSAIYNRFIEDKFIITGKWTSFQDDKTGFKADGALFSNILKKDSGKLFMAHDLDGSNYAEPDSCIIKYKTCLGQPVISDGNHLGVICIFYQDDYMPGQWERSTFEIIASAIEVEEKRFMAQEDIKKPIN